MNEASVASGPLVAELDAVSVIHQTPFGPVAALDQVSVGFPSRTSTALVGRSGAGKSTMMSVLAMLRTPTEGSYRFAGRDVGSLSPSARARLRADVVGIAFQSFHLENSLSAVQNMLLPWRLARPSPSSAGLAALNSAQVRDRARDLLELLGVGQVADRRPREMSGGQRQRVAIGRALMSEPQLFIADEPTGALDESTAGVIGELLFSLPEKLGTTVVVVTHDLVLARSAQHTHTLSEGRLVAGEVFA